MIQLLYFTELSELELLLLFQVLVARNWLAPIDGKSNGKNVLNTHVSIIGPTTISIPQTMAPDYNYSTTLPRSG